MRIIINIYIVILVCLAFVSCSTVPDKLDTNVIYKKDIRYWVNGKKMRGVGVAPAADSYTVYIEYPEGRIDILELLTCHRHENISNEGTKATYIYRPTEIEARDNCTLDIGIYDKKGRHGWGLLLFESDRFKVKAKVECNGVVTNANGISACQSRIGTTQQLSFEEPMTVRGDCKIEQVGNTFTYRMGEKLCYFRFSNSRREAHRHVSFGFQTFIIRE